LTNDRGSIMGWMKGCWILAVAGLCCAVAACDDDTSDGPSDGGGGNDVSSDGDTGGGGDETMSFCEAKCAADERCDASTPDTCVADCVADPPVEDLHLFSDTFLAAYEACLRDRECDASEQECVEAAFATLGPDFESEEPFVGCMSRRTECDSEFSDDLCYDVAGYSDEAIADAEACLAGECTAVADCIDGL
jgi:hypothetical protein